MCTANRQESPSNRSFQTLPVSRMVYFHVMLRIWRIKAPTYMTLCSLSWSKECNCFNNSGSSPFSTGLYPISIKQVKILPKTRAPVYFLSAELPTVSVLHRGTKQLHSHSCPNQNKNETNISLSLHLFPPRQPLSLEDSTLPALARDTVCFPIPGLFWLRPYHPLSSNRYPDPLSSVDCEMCPHFHLTVLFSQLRA